jgi:cell division protease FtsH
MIISIILNFLVLLIFIIIRDDNYEYTNPNDFLNKIYNKNIYFNKNQYCVVENIYVFHKDYLCTYGIEPITEKVHFVDYNITSIQYTDLSYSSNATLRILFFLIILALFLSINISDKNNDSSGLFNLIKNIFISVKIKSKKEDDATINNFIGCNNIKKEMNKIINQIKYNEIYNLNDCTLPKGILLLGAPGCGKTHLVKTIIHSTGIKYIFASGSDFNKLYVGSGSSKISEIFSKARRQKPCLIFIDEADALLTSRNYNTSSSTSSEFNSTICKLLEEMDSLKSKTGVIIIFASNMNEENIDKGMLRSGRIDQIIHVDNPTLDERIELFKMYLKDLYDENKIDLNRIAKLSYGLTGSDIKKIVNSIKINKVYDIIQIKEDNKEVKKEVNIKDKIQITVNTDDIDKEINRCILGLERDRKINELNKKIIAYHEAGHAIMAFLLKDSIIPSKICISINSKSLGYTMFNKDDEDLLMGTSINFLLREVMILYAGRASENVFLNEVTCGAEDDYMKARKILKRLLMNGMLIPEYNMVETTRNKNSDKIPDELEKKLNLINKFVIKNVELYLENYKQIVIKTAELILENNCITGDDITLIFRNENVEDDIQKIDIIEIHKDILNLIKN